MFFLTNLIITLIEMIPKMNDVSITINIPSQFTVICAENNFIVSKTALATMIGMLIKNEKSSAGYFSTPASNTLTRVEPLLEMPGKSAHPCASPI